MDFFGLLDEIQSLMEQGEYQKTKSIIDENIDLYDENSEEIFLLKTFIGAILRDEGRNLEAISLLIDINVQSKNLKLHLPRLFALSELSYNYFKLSHYDLMREIIKETEDVLIDLVRTKSKYSNFQEIILSKIYNVQGLYHWNTGSLSLAVNDFKMYMEKCIQIEHEHGVGVSLNNLAALNYTLGNIELALEYIEQAIAIWGKLKKLRGYAYGYKNLGLIYYAQNKTNLALTNLELAFEYFGQINNRIDQAISVFHMILICLNDDQLLTSKDKYLSDLKLISEKYDQKIISIHYHMALNINYMKKGRLREITRAYAYFQQAIDENIEFKLSGIAIKYMCEYLILELKNVNSEQVFKELVDLVKKLRRLGESAPSYTTLVESLILDAKIIFSTGDLKSATLLLEKAQKIAEEHGLFNLSTRINDENELFISRISNIQRMIEKDASKFDLLNEVAMQDYIEEVKKVIGI
ncbi:MAG: hypothetical protein HeimC2_41280 [Candidatus Heimdallarchaeota archaeon LC_2]|nr:MAG: hypothetical protein HeimC2_41280 [Candidatus Heimdallarchaeota archaeon LC_2]